MQANIFEMTLHENNIEIYIYIKCIISNNNKIMVIIISTLKNILFAIHNFKFKYVRQKEST